MASPKVFHYTSEGRITGNISKSLYSAQKRRKKWSSSSCGEQKLMSSFFLVGLPAGFSYQPLSLQPKSPKIVQKRWSPVDLLTQEDVLGKPSACPDFVWTPPLNTSSHLIYLNETTNPIMARCPALCPRRREAQGLLQKGQTFWWPSSPVLWSFAFCAFASSMQASACHNSKPHHYPCRVEGFLHSLKSFFALL